MPIIVGRSADLRLQVIRDDLKTTWKASSQQSSGWTPWQPFPAPAVSLDPAQPVQQFAIAQLPAVNPDREIPGNTGRMQLWGLLNPVGGSPALYSTTKSSEHPNAPWGPWDNSNAPQPASPFSASSTVIWDIAVAQLADGRLQLWASYDFAGPGSALWSTVMTGPLWNDPWSPWQPFNLPNQPGLLWQLAAAPLPSGGTQLWAIGDTGTGAIHDALPWTVYTTTRLASAGTSADAQAGWSPWTPFTMQDEKTFPKARGLQTAVDGAGRAYLWVAVPDESGEITDNEVPLQWMYTYSAKRIVGQAVAPDWSPLQDQNFPIPPAAQGNPQEDGGKSALSAAPLPDGNLQLFYYPQGGQQGGPATVVSTRWQQLGQAPTSWTQWQTPFQPLRWSTAVHHRRPDLLVAPLPGC